MKFVRFLTIYMTVTPEIQVEISPRLLNIFPSGFFKNKSMILLLTISTFPALPDEFAK